MSLFTVYCEWEYTVCCVLQAQCSLMSVHVLIVYLRNPNTSDTRALQCYLSLFCHADTHYLSPCGSTLTHKPSLHLTLLSFPLILCILDLGYLYIFRGRGSFIWFFTLAKFLLNPQAFSAGADPRSRWTV